MNKWLDVLFFQLVHNIFRCPHGQGQYGPGRIFICLGHKSAAVYYEEVLYFVGLVELVQHGFVRIVAHTGGTHLMDDTAGVFQPVFGICAGFGAISDAAHFMDDLFKSILHVFSLLDLMIAPGIMEAKHRNTEFIHYAGINFAIIVFPGNTFAPAGKADLGAVKAAVVVFQAGAVATGFLRLAIAAGRHVVHHFHPEPVEV